MTLERALRYIVLACVFALPFIVLYVSRSMFFPFITGKNFAFRIFVEIAASGWLALAVMNPAYRPRRTWLLWAFGAFVLLIGISDILGVYPFKSFWSNYERMEGWVSLAHLFAYFVVMSAMLNTEKLWRYWWHTSLGVSLLVGLFAVLQLAGIYTINQGGVRLDATFGNSTYLGIYMLFHMFIAALLFARSWIGEEEGTPSHVYYLIAGAVQIPSAVLAFGSETEGAEAMIALLVFSAGIWLYAWARASGGRLAQLGLVGLMLVQGFALFFTSTRGAILGLIGGAMLAGLLLIVQSPRSPSVRYIGAALAGVIALAGVLWMARDTSVVRNIQPLFRLATILEDTTTFSRFMNWGMALEGFKERPLLGWGQENYAAVFDKYYDPDMWGQEPWFDRTHNVLFDWLIAGGILGLLAYLSLHFFALYIIWRSGAFAPYERAILTGLFAGYFFYNLFTFDNITSYIFFVSMLAYIATRAVLVRGEVQQMRTNPSVQIPAAAGAAILAAGLIWFVNVDAIRQNWLLISAIQPQTGGASQNLAFFKQAAAVHSVGEQEVREQIAQVSISLVGAQDQPVELKQQFMQLTSEEMQKQMADAPLNARGPFFLGILFDHAGIYPEAKKWLEEARKRSPRKQAILFELGLNATARNEPQEALAYFKEAYELAPEYRGARVYYISALIRAGDDATADEILQPLIEDGTAVEQRIASALAARNQYGKIVTIWTAHIQKNPEDLDARFLLAGAYYAMGNSAASIRELEATKQAIPSAAAQADELIRQVRSGVPVQ